MKIYELHPTIVERPRRWHRKRRIRKKWAKRFGVVRVPIWPEGTPAEGQCIVDRINGVIYARPATVQALKQAMVQP
jgi:hypothetical protein